MEANKNKGDGVGNELAYAEGLSVLEGVSRSLRLGEVEEPSFFVFFGMYVCLYKQLKQSFLEQRRSNIFVHRSRTEISSKLSKNIYFKMNLSV